jgi:hypothetical protein
VQRPSFKHEQPLGKWLKVLLRFTILAQKSRALRSIGLLMLRRRRRSGSWPTAQARTSELGMKDEQPQGHNQHTGWSRHAGRRKAMEINQPIIQLGYKNFSHETRQTIYLPNTHADLKHTFYNILSFNQKKSIPLPVRLLE